MSVEYRHYLIPIDARRRPSAEQLVKLAGKIVDQGWIAGPDLPTGGWTIETREQEEGPFVDLSLEKLAVMEDVDYKLIGYDSGKRLPLNTEVPSDPEDAEYKLELYLATDYIYESSEVCYEADYPGGTVCPNCGEDVQYEWEGGNLYAWNLRTYRRCPHCSAEIDPSHWPVILKNAWTGEEKQRNGGVAYRFAVVINIGGARLNTQTGQVRFAPALVELCEQTLGQSFSEVWHID